MIKPDPKIILEKSINDLIKRKGNSNFTGEEIQREIVYLICYGVLINWLNQAKSGSLTTFDRDKDIMKYAKAYTNAAKKLLPSYPEDSCNNAIEAVFSVMNSSNLGEQLKSYFQNAHNFILDTELIDFASSFYDASEIELEKTFYEYTIDGHQLMFIPTKTSSGKILVNTDSGTIQVNENEYKKHFESLLPKHFNGELTEILRMRYVNYLNSIIEERGNPKKWEAKVILSISSFIYSTLITREPFKFQMNKTVDEFYTYLLQAPLISSN